ncbi:tetraacyldisaccharide 4'-kinase [Lichenifustis flavocetrariae]|uniref:Tetraacyldisaccharide 4'-kinase n=1 Tax=Lichenifustis flavocetrariae TaxID=2949735 RepID=A0AA41YTP8_9HYPH|nr:tetraacyldisaccharide 4'-kinase [Lichenifustis flavocetrariae]MCW6507140.1 tetraacyldisaccharide 4'-kinase [Lichenifustis flavocetrariae]
MRQAPAFWWRGEPGVAARMLQPVGALYGTVTALRMAQPGVTLPIPVICVGNLVAGGAGKTPTALAFARILASAGHRPAFLSRGYGRRVPKDERRAILRVDPARHEADLSGDEPLLLARAAPTYVSADRVAAGHQAFADGATVLLLDDGLQNPTLRKTIAVAVIDAASGIGNGLCVPAGPLRAPLGAQWPFVTAVCLIGEGKPGDDVAGAARRHRLPIFRGQLIPDEDALNELRGKPLYAFAGIGRPDKFFATLSASGLEVRGHRAFADHHRFSSSDLTGLQRLAASAGAHLVTTTKDQARLTPSFPALCLPVSLVFDDAASVKRLLLDGLPPGDGLASRSRSA